MKAKKFLSKRKRMCDSFGDSCEGCPLSIIENLHFSCETVYMDDDSIDKTINIVKKWSKKHKKNKGDHK